MFHMSNLFQWLDEGYIRDKPKNTFAAYDMT
jgi:hypothetical protein